MARLLEEEKELLFKPVINDCPGAQASMQILHPEISAAEFRHSVSRQREIILAERDDAQVWQISKDPCLHL